MKVVLDTNVLISGLINPNGMPAKIINLLINQKMILFYDNRILEEYEDVLHRDKFKFTDDIINPLLNFIKSEGQFVAADPLSTVFKDENDKMFLEVAESAHADYTITGNKNHFPKINCIVTPKEFIDKLD